MPWPWATMDPAPFRRRRGHHLAGRRRRAWTCRAFRRRGDREAGSCRRKVVRYEPKGTVPSGRFARSAGDPSRPRSGMLIPSTRAPAAKPGASSGSLPTGQRPGRFATPATKRDGARRSTRSFHEKLAAGSSAPLESVATTGCRGVAGCRARRTSHSRSRTILGAVSRGTALGREDLQRSRGSRAIGRLRSPPRQIPCRPEVAGRRGARLRARALRARLSANVQRARSQQ